MEESEFVWAIAKEALEKIAKDPEAASKFLEKELSLPNVPFPTMGGKVFWNEIENYNGWRLQQNMVTKHARILRPDDVRVAWGTIEGMYKALDRLVAGMKEDRYAEKISSEESSEAAARLKRLKDLLDSGAITQLEYDKKKAELMDSL